MAHYRGLVHGSRSSESRLSTKSIGLTTEAQTYNGKIVVSLNWSEKDQKDRVRVTFEDHEGNGPDRTVTLIDSFLQDLPNS